MFSLVVFKISLLLEAKVSNFNQPSLGAEMSFYAPLIRACLVAFISTAFRSFVERETSIFTELLNTNTSPLALSTDTQGTILSVFPDIETYSDSAV